ncbi:unnamed protein product [Phytomonas sp. Hart1]|nr:unnamed protein product [Phytomonas sp. Hart1]|eukprot:CCW70044.1 unnamed protein product [Phytomonas sp. isolate Hart1]
MRLSFKGLNSPVLRVPPVHLWACGGAAWRAAVICRQSRSNQYSRPKHYKGCSTGLHYTNCILPRPARAHTHKDDSKVRTELKELRPRAHTECIYFSNRFSPKEPPPSNNKKMDEK